MITHLLDHVIMAHLHILLDHHIRAHEQYQTNDQAQSYLPDDLETSVHALLILLEHLDIIIRESQGSQPNRSHQHQYHIDIIQLGTQ